MSNPEKKFEIALIMTFKIPSNMIKLGFFNFGVLNNLMSFFGLAMLGLIQDYNQGITKPNQAKPNPFMTIHRCF